jgi:hypothetical protein
VKRTIDSSRQTGNDGDMGDHQMSSLSADPHKTTISSDVQLRRVQYRWATMLRRADARESALESALVHARAEELRLQRQLEEQQRQHTIESRLLRDRLHRLEQCLLSYATTARKALSAPLGAMRDSGKLLGSHTQSPKRLPLLAAAASNPDSGATEPAPFLPASVIPASVVPGPAMPTTVMPTSVVPAPVMPTTVMPTPAMPTTVVPAPVMPTPAMPTTAMPAPAMPAPLMPTTAPFDPVAIVASMLPLGDVQAEVSEGNLAGALDRMRGIVGRPDPLRVERAPLLASTPARPVLVTTAPIHDQPERHAEPDEHQPSRERIGGSDTPWFPRAFRRLADEDPKAAGRLLLQLLPAQGLVWPEDVTYRIEVAETGALAVEVSGGHSTVQPLLDTSAARPGEATLRCDLAGLARTVVARRGWSRFGARIAASRNRHLRPLRALAAAPLQLSDIRRTGAEPDPALLLRLLALAIDPRWTAEEIFTVACRWRGRMESGFYVHIFENAPVAVTSAPPLGRVAATLTCEPGDLLDILLGDIPLGHALARVSGDRATLARLLEWFQCVDATATTIPLERGEHALVEV